MCCDTHTRHDARHDPSRRDERARRGDTPLKYPPQVDPSLMDHVTTVLTSPLDTPTSLLLSDADLGTPELGKFGACIPPGIHPQPSRFLSRAPSSAPSSATSPTLTHFPAAGCNRWIVCQSICHPAPIRHLLSWPIFHGEAVDEGRSHPGHTAVRP